MSSSIIYHQLGVVFPREATGQAEDLFAIVGQVGPSNCYEYSGRRTRSWQGDHFGTEAMVVKQAIEIASYCEGGSIKLRHMGATMTPEQYIARIRALLKKARTNNITLGAVPFKDGVISCYFEDRLADPSVCPVNALVRHEATDHQALKVLFGAPAFWESIETQYAHQYLKVRGPELRNSH